jgi:hypothetical protein
VGGIRDWVSQVLIGLGALLLVLALGILAIAAVVFFLNSL